MNSDESLLDWLERRPAAALEAIQEELERRALDDFGLWLELRFPTWRWDWAHLRYMRANLARVTSGAIRYLAQFCPPRHGKTEQNTVRYAAWRIIRDPTCRVIIGAYNQGLAEKFSRKVRRIVEQEVELNPAQTSVKDWATKAGGGVRACGVGSGVTGTGADVIIVDDPVKSRTEAESPAFRRRLWDWFTDDLFTRQEPGCSILLTLTRWHEKDLAGQIMAHEAGSDWEFHNLPAIAEEGDPLGRMPGEALCPERYPIAELEKRKRLMGRNFFALFQGRPRPSEGDAYKRAWFRYWTWADDGHELIRLARDDGRTRTVRLADCRVFATADLATTEKTAADYTVFATWAVTPASDLILLHLEREQFEQPAIIDLAYRIQLRWNPAYFAVESNGIGSPILQMIRRGTTNSEGVWRPGLAVRGIPSVASKLSRASTAIVRTEAGQVFFPARAPWLEAFEAELLGFGPKCPHDDQVDALSLAASDVFQLGGSGIDDEVTELAKATEAEAEQEARSAAWHDPAAEHWWPEGD